jgi:hypothetical protein
LPEKYQVALNFIRELKATLLTSGIPQVEFVVIPGNHDCDLSNELDTRTCVLDSVEKYRSKPIDLTGLSFQAVRIQIGFKTLQILGQVLRNFTGSLDGDLKLQITHRSVAER